MPPVKKHVPKSEDIPKSIQVSKFKHIPKSKHAPKTLAPLERVPADIMWKIFKIVPELIFHLRVVSFNCLFSFSNVTPNLLSDTLKIISVFSDFANNQDSSWGVCLSHFKRRPVPETLLHKTEKRSNWGTMRFDDNSRTQNSAFRTTSKAKFTNFIHNKESYSMLILTYWTFCRYFAKIYILFCAGIQFQVDSIQRWFDNSGMLQKVLGQACRKCNAQ